MNQPTLSLRTMMAAVATTLALLTASGCAVMRDQSTVGSYVDDASITTAVKARFAENPEVSAMAIGVETLNGTVQLSGFAKSATERANAEALARKVKGVKSVKNDIIVRG